MADDEPVPEADLQEQREPLEEDPRAVGSHDQDAAEADLVEQELPVERSVGRPAGVDADREEPIADADDLEEDLGP